MDAKRCKGTNKVGKPCKVWPTRGKDYCRAHDPDLTGIEKFGSPEHAGWAGGHEKPRIPKPMELAQRLVEENMEAVVAPYFEALGIFRGADGVWTYDRQRAARIYGKSASTGYVNMSDFPDLEVQLKAAEAILNRLYGRPKQAVELGTGDSGPIQVDLVSDERIASDARDLLRRAALQDDGGHEGEQAEPT